MTMAQQLTAKGKIEGKIDGKIEVVRNAWEGKFTIAQITQLTKLPVEKIIELISQFEKEAIAN